MCFATSINCSPSYDGISTPLDDGAPFSCRKMILSLLLLGKPSCDGRERWEAGVKRWRRYSAGIHDKTFTEQEALYSG